MTRLVFDMVVLNHCAWEAAVTYLSLRDTTARQHRWLVNRVHQFTKVCSLKKEQSKRGAIEQATRELHETEPILEASALGIWQNLRDNWKQTSTVESFPFESFPTAKDFLTQVGAYDWFQEGYATKMNSGGLPTMNLKVLDIRPVGKHLVYDIEVEKIHSFLANGIVAHNCMISHGVSRFLRERLFDVSDYFEIFVCESCGTTPHQHAELQCV